MMKLERVLKKQNPRKVGIEQYYSIQQRTNIYAYVCPACGAYVHAFVSEDLNGGDYTPDDLFREAFLLHCYRGKYNYCDRCGQKLDWREIKKGGR